jgi:hypothetical protein
MAYLVHRFPPYSLRKTFAAGSLTSVTASGGPQYTPRGAVSGPLALSAPDTLVGWWRLNTDVSSEGDAPDSSAGGNAGTMPLVRPAYSVLTPSTRIQAASDVFDGAADGTIINIGASTVWDAIIGNDTDGGSTQKMSFSMWVYKTGDGHANLGHMISMGAENTNIYIKSDPNEALWFGTYWDLDGTPAEVYWRATAAFSLNTWTHIVITYDASSPSNDPLFYVNATATAVVEAGTTPTGLWVGITGESTIGGRYSPGPDGAFGTFKGNLADVAIWDKILTSDEVGVLYRAASYDIWRTTRNWSLQGSSTSGEDIDQFSSKEDGEFALSINPFRQGINVDEMKYVEMGLTPKISAGTRTKLILNGVDMSAQKYFDDAVISNSSDVKLISGSRKEVPNFEMEPQNFGQAKLFNDDVPYMEMQKFDAVSYLTDDTGALVYPYVGSNPAAKDPYQNDGVIEPLYQIRQSVSLMTIDFPFLAQGVRGTMQGEYATDSRQGGVLITQQINNVTSSLDPYEDSGAEYFGANSSNSVALPGFLTEQQARTGPWVDDTFMSIHIKQIQTGSQDFTTAMEALSGTNTQRMLQNHHRSATAGFVYENNTLGTDSIAFGGWKK